MTKISHSSVLAALAVVVIIKYSSKVLALPSHIAIIHLHNGQESDQRCDQHPDYTCCFVATVKHIGSYSPCVWIANSV